MRRAGDEPTETDAYEEKEEAVEACDDILLLYKESLYPLQTYLNYYLCLELFLVISSPNA
jgi:hypothetical protein